MGELAPLFKKHYQLITRQADNNPHAAVASWVRVCGAADWRTSRRPLVNTAEPERPGITRRWPRRQHSPGRVVASSASPASRQQHPRAPLRLPGCTQRPRSGLRVRRNRPAASAGSATATGRAVHPLPLGAEPLPDRGDRDLALRTALGGVPVVFAVVVGPPRQQPAWAGGGGGGGGVEPGAKEMTCR